MDKVIILHSGLTPSAAVDTLRRSIDEEQRTILSWSGYKGGQPVLGVITGNGFRLQKRPYGRNDFAPYFYGQMLPEPGGTRIEGHFDFSEWVRVLMWFWLPAVGAMGILAFIATLIKLLNHTQTENDALGLIVPTAMIVLGFVLPRFGRLLGKDEEAYLLQYLQDVFAARMESVD